MSTLTYTGTLQIETCCNCGIAFAMPTRFYREKRQDHGTFYCPAGHAQHYTSKSDAELLEEERRRSTRRLELLNDEREQHRRTERRLNATRGVVTRTKKRIASGVCPCCARTFVGLGRHMAAKHPDYVERVEP